MAFIGIDLGTTNSLACVYQKGEMILIPNQLGKYQTPSVVSYTENGLVVGEAAKSNLILSPDQTAASFKTFMGTNKIYNLGGETYLPEELSALVIKQNCCRCRNISARTSNRSNYQCSCIFQ